MVNSVAYESIAFKGSCEDTFQRARYHQDSFVRKRFDFIMVYGDSNKIRDLSLICRDNGGAFIKIAPIMWRMNPTLYF